MGFFLDEREVGSKRVILRHANIVSKIPSLLHVNKLGNRFVPRISDDRKFIVTLENIFSHFGLDLCRKKMLQSSSLVFIVIL